MGEGRLTSRCGRRRPCRWFSGESWFSARRLLLNLPPFLFFRGTDDRLVPLDQSKRLAEKLQGVGVPARVVVLEGEGHGVSDAKNQQAMKEMLDFLGERLKP
jgi:dipeptidyl aminopeptidase/acylaminoacyl peptidase